MEKQHLSKIPKEGLSYFTLFRGAEVSLRIMREEAPLSAIAAEGLIFEGRALTRRVVGEDYSSEIVVFIPNLTVAPQEAE